MPIRSRNSPRRLASVARVTVAIAILSVTATADEADPFQPVRERIAKGLVDHNIPSISVAVAKDGKIIWEQGFGWADRENRVAASEHTMYSLASISKPITATGLMVLKARGKIDLDKPANEYLGDSKLMARVGDTSQATVRRIANHTAGLPLHYQFFYDDEPYKVPTREETIRRFGNLVTAPGERYQYSNLGYGVLDYIIQRADGRKYADFMREEVFLPLGMTRSSVGIGPGLEQHQAIRYTPNGKRIPFYDFDHPGASAVYASAHDLVRFAMFHMKEHLADQKPIFSDAVIDEMQVSTTNSQDRYGIGWGSGSDGRGHLTISHSGGMPGVATLCRLLPQERVAVVVLANTGTPLVGYVSGMILKIVVPENKDESKPASEETAKHDESTAPPPFSAISGKWKGHVKTYQGEIPLVLDVKNEHDVHVRLGDQLQTLLSDAGFRGGFLRGRFAGDLDLEESRGRRTTLQLEAKLRESALNGSLTMHTAFDGRGSSATTYWVELKRVGSSDPKPSADAAGQ